MRKKVLSTLALGLLALFITGFAAGKLTGYSIFSADFAGVNVGYSSLVILIVVTLLLLTAEEQKEGWPHHNYTPTKKELLEKTVSEELKGKGLKMTERPTDLFHRNSFLNIEVGRGGLAGIIKDLTTMGWHYPFVEFDVKKGELYDVSVHNTRYLDLAKKIIEDFKTKTGEKRKIELHYEFKDRKYSVKI